MTLRKIAAHYLYSDRKLLKWPIVSVADNGCISDISLGDEHIDRLEGVEFYSGILIPDMVNAHTHLELSYLKGAIEPHCGFAGFAKAIAGVRGNFTAKRRQTAISAADAAMWHDGVGAVADICNGSTTFDTKRNSNIDYTNLLELFGLQTVSAAPLKECEAAAAKAGLKYGLTPHSTYSLNNAAFSAAIRAEDPTPLSIHFMESPSEKQLYAKSGELWDWYSQRGMRADFLDYRSPAQRVVDNVPAERRVLLIHNCCVEEEDVEIIDSHFGDNAVWVLCPQSNLYISKLVPPVELLRHKRVRIALGTDSLASNTTLSMVEEMKCFKGVPLEELIEWATCSGAKALGIDSRTGKIEVGRRSGIVLLGGIDWRTMSLTNESLSERIF